MEALFCSFLCFGLYGYGLWTMGKLVRGLVKDLVTALLGLLLLTGSALLGSPALGWTFVTLLLLAYAFFYDQELFPLQWKQTILPGRVSGHFGGGFEPGGHLRQIRQPHGGQVSRLFEPAKPARRFRRRGTLAPDHPLITMHAPPKPEAPPKTALARQRPAFPQGHMRTAKAHSFR